MSPQDLTKLGAEIERAAGVERERLGVVIVDHGSRRGESNDLLVAVVNWFRSSTGLANVEPAHMELCAPSIGDSVDRVVGRGAELVVVLPYFLAPGRHWTEDIPRLTGEAAGRWPGVKWLVTSPLGIHEALIGVLTDRLRQCVEHASGAGADCELCRGTEACRVQSS